MDLILLVVFVLAKDVGFFLEDLTKLLDDACLSVVEVTSNVDITSVVLRGFVTGLVDDIVLHGGLNVVLDLGVVVCCGDDLADNVDVK